MWCLEGPPRVQRQLSSFALSSRAEGPGELPGVCLIRARMSFGRAPPSGPTHLPTAPPPAPSPGGSGGWGVQPLILAGEGHKFQSLEGCLCLSHHHCQTLAKAFRSPWGYRQRWAFGVQALQSFKGFVLIGVRGRREESWSPRVRSPHWAAPLRGPAWGTARRTRSSLTTRRAGKLPVTLPGLWDTSQGARLVSRRSEGL